MKKVLMFNFNVGGGIEYCGDIFADWLRKKENIEFVEIKEQDQASHIIQVLIHHKPDIIVINEKYDRVIQPVFYYKMFNHRTKVLLLNHDWHTLITDLKNMNRYEEASNIFAKDFYSMACDIIINLNSPPSNINWPVEIKHKIMNKYFPVGVEFENKTPWKDRENMFVILGRVYPLKISEEFIDKISGTGLEIHCYGSKAKTTQEYINKFDECKELVYKGSLPQEKVADVLNQYKYFVMPHEGYEVFCIALLQAIKCGTIPLVCNEMDKGFDVSWIDWARGMYFGCRKQQELIDNLCETIKVNPDHSGESMGISIAAMEKFPYEGIKQTFFVAMTYLIEDVPYGGYHYR